MKREDVIRLAKEAGIEFIGEYTPHTKGLEKWERFAALVAAAERDRCAKVCEDRGNRNRIAASLPNGDRDEFYCADDIRALGGE